MEFLYKLYSYNYFGIGLFIVITILAFAFLIILFFGKKDEKTRRELQKIEENREAINQLEANKVEPEKEELEPISLENIKQELKIEEPVEEVPVFTNNLEPVREEKEFSNPSVHDELDLDFDIDTTSIQKDFNIERTNQELEDKELDIFNREPSINIENEYDNEPISYEENRREIPEESYDYQEERNREQFREEYNDEPETRENTRKTMPSVFSSVYKNNEREDIFPEENYQTDYMANLEPETYELKQEEPVEQVVYEEPVREVKPITTKKPEFVMPKRADMPKLNKTNDNNDSIIKF